MRACFKTTVFKNNAVMCFPAVMRNNKPFTSTVQHPSFLGPRASFWTASTLPSEVNGLTKAARVPSWGKTAVEGSGWSSVENLVLM